MPLNRLTQRALNTLLELHEISNEENIGSGENSTQKDSQKSGKKASNKGKKAISAKSLNGEKVKALTVVEMLKKSGGISEKVLNGNIKLKFAKTREVEIQQLLKESYFQALKLQQPYVGTEHLLLALLKLINSRDYNNVKAEILRLGTFPGVLRPAELENQTPILTLYGENATYQSIVSGEDYVYRGELDKIISTLLQKDSPNPLLVGEFGVGKQALVNLLIQRINSLDVPPRLIGYQVVDFDLVQFIAGAFNKGTSVEQSLSMLINEIKSLGRVILHIKNFQNIFVPTNSGVAVPLVYSLFRSGLNTAGIKVIASMESYLYDRVSTENSTILENFTIIDVDEPTKDQTLNVMYYRAKQLEEFHNIKISKKVIKYTYEKSEDINVDDLSFPLKGLQILDKACAHLVSKESKVPSRYKDLIDETFILASKIDDCLEKGDYSEALKYRDKLEKVEDKLSADERKMFLSKKVALTITEVDAVLEEPQPKEENSQDNLDMYRDLDKKLKKKIIGQNKALEVVVKSLIRSKLGLRSQKRPVGNFLFLGPTGVGKTELAKVLAEEAFGANSLIRLDMSDFGEKHTVARLVGAPPGYVGYGEGGELTQKIDAKPQSVVLFDEIEKAHPDVLNILLQIMEEGELSDARGSTYSFSSAVIILTSNLGTEILHKGEIGFEDNFKSEDTVEARLKENLKRILKPELINRFDEVVVFRRLSKQSQMKVINLLISEIKKTLKEQNVKLSIGVKPKNYLIEKGYSDEYGARALRRTVEKELLDRIAEVLLTSKRTSGEVLDLKAVVEGLELKIVNA